MNSRQKIDQFIQNKRIDWSTLPSDLLIIILEYVLSPGVVKRLRQDNIFEIRESCFDMAVPEYCLPLMADHFANFPSLYMRILHEIDRINCLSSFVIHRILTYAAQMHSLDMVRKIIQFYRTSNSLNVKSKSKSILSGDTKLELNVASFDNRMLYYRYAPLVYIGEFIEFEQIDNIASMFELPRHIVLPEIIMGAARAGRLLLLHKALDLIRTNIDVRHKALIGSMHCESIRSIRFLSGGNKLFFTAKWATCSLMSSSVLYCHAASEGASNEIIPWINKYRKDFILHIQHFEHIVHTQPLEVVRELFNLLDHPPDGIKPTVTEYAARCALTTAEDPNIVRALCASGASYASEIRCGRTISLQNWNIAGGQRRSLKEFLGCFVTNYTLWTYFSYCALCYRPNSLHRSNTQGDLELASGTSTYIDTMRGKCKKHNMNMWRLFHTVKNCSPRAHIGSLKILLTYMERVGMKILVDIINNKIKIGALQVYLTRSNIQSN